MAWDVFRSGPFGGGHARRSGTFRIGRAKAARKPPGWRGRRAGKDEENEWERMRR